MVLIAQVRSTFALPPWPTTLAPATFDHGSKAGMDLTRPAQLLQALRAPIDKQMFNSTDIYEERVGKALAQGSDKEYLPLLAAAGILLCSLTVFQANAM